MDSRLRSVLRATPAAFTLFKVAKGDDKEQEDEQTFSVTILHCQSIDRYARPVLLLTKEALDDDLDIELEYDGTTTAINVKATIGTTTLTAEQFRAACTYDMRLFAFIETRETFDAEQLPYLLLPSVGAENKIDWDEVFAANARPNLQPLYESGLLDSVTEQSAGLLQDRTILEGTSFAERPLIAVRLRPDLRCDRDRWADDATGNAEKLEVTDIYGKKFKNFPKEDVNVDQPLLEVISSCKAADFLAGCKVLKPELNFSRRFVTVPQVCQLGPMSVSLLRACRIVPSILTELGRQMLARSIGKRVLLSCITEQPLLLRALTLSNTRSSSNYEQLEFFGDCVLKLCATMVVFCQGSQHGEGTMTMKRALLIENEHLCRLAQRWQLAEHVFGHGPVPKHWRPHGLEADQRERTLQLSDKTLADLVEALLGAAWLCKGSARRRLERAFVCINHLAIFPDDISLQSFQSQSLSHIYSNINITSTCDLHNLNGLQNSIAYTFRHPFLAQQAFTHASRVQGDLTRSYERLEFLGDAVLEACFCMWVYERHPELKEGQYTALKAYATCNASLAVLCVTTGLYKYVEHKASELQTRIDSFAATVLSTTTSSGSQRHRRIANVTVPFWCSLANVPKQLADVVESLFGAIFLDSDFDIKVTKELFKRTFCDHLATYLSVDLLAVDPSQLGVFKKDPKTKAALSVVQPIVTLTTVQA